MNWAAALVLMLEMSLVGLFLRLLSKPPSKTVPVSHRRVELSALLPEAEAAQLECRGMHRS